MGSLSVPRLQTGVPILTGFDVEIERALAGIMSVEIALPEIAWEDHLAALAAGTADIAAGATASEARSLYAYFSKPYRTETDVLILPEGHHRPIPFSDDRADARHLREAEVSPRGCCGEKAVDDAGEEVSQVLSIARDGNDLVPVSPICNEGVNAVVGIDEPSMPNLRVRVST